MTNNTVNDVERMVVTRVFDAPRELVWKAWTDPKYVMQWWGPKGFTAPVCQMDVRVGGKSLLCMKTPDGYEGWNAIEYHEIVLHEKIVSSMYFSDSEGNKIDPEQLGMEQAIDGVRYDSDPSFEGVYGMTSARIERKPTQAIPEKSLGEREA